MRTIKHINIHRKSIFRVILFFCKQSKKIYNIYYKIHSIRNLHKYIHVSHVKSTSNSAVALKQKKIVRSV